uniref:GIY-YIG nuclease family protein n=1 Tax=Algoriphagus locisalis TaxID=305507 RepID=UPI000B80B66F
MYYVYILYSPKTDKYYTGSTDNLALRLIHHNSSSTPSTKSGAPNWILSYSEYFPDRTSELKRQLEIKKKKIYQMDHFRKPCGLAQPVSTSRKHSGRSSVRLRYPPLQKLRRNVRLFVFF